MSLCPFCRAIPDHFFQPDLALLSKVPEYSFKDGITHLPIPYMETSARNGCPLCAIMLTGNGARTSLDPESLASERTTLRWAMIDPERAFRVCVGFDDYNHVFYYQVPSPFGKESDRLRCLALISLIPVRYETSDGQSSKACGGLDHYKSLAGCVLQ